MNGRPILLTKSQRDIDMKYKGKWICSKECEICEGKGMVVSGMEGFINRNMEQDCRDTYAPCENAIFDEPDYDNEREWHREREEA